MKKQIMALIFILLLVGSVVWMITEGTKPEVLPLGGKLPKISITTKDGIKTIAETKGKLLIIFFSKDCPHCKYELSILNENIEKLNNARIYLLTADKNFLNSEDINVYQNLLENKNVTFGIVDKEESKRKFGDSALPTLFFFDKKGKLTAKIKGETKFGRILSELRIKNDEF